MGTKILRDGTTGNVVLMGRKPGNGGNGTMEGNVMAARDVAETKGETLNDAYAQGLSEGLRRGYAMGFNTGRREAEKRDPYFTKMRILGVILLVWTAVTVAVCKDATVAILTIPLSISMCFGHTRWLYQRPEDRQEG